MLAAQRGHAEIVTCLIQSGSIVDKQTVRTLFFCSL